MYYKEEQVLQITEHFMYYLILANNKSIFF